MKTQLSTEERKVIGAASSSPEVSLILPFEPVLSSKEEFRHRLKAAIEKVASELEANYPDEKARPVIARLKNLLDHLPFDASKKGLAIFISPLVEKVFYLDIAVHERIVIDESFEIRDLVYMKKRLIRYLVLLLSGEAAKVYLGDGNGLLPIGLGVPDNKNAYERDLPTRVANFSDPAMHRETVLDHFLHRIDQGLTKILQSYPLPVFVMGVERVLGHFKGITRNEKSVVQFIHGNYLGASEAEVLEVVAPCINDWQKILEKVCLGKVDRAMSEGKLEYGIKQVWQAATQKNGHLLVVEKDFVYPAHEGSQPDSIYREDPALNNAFYIKDAVDDIMEKVLMTGGDVEFVSNGALVNYGRIALIKFY
ncbi:MAG: hypothetical protein P4L51_15485 [Puia sp.]|nr:hypothetical protein [Puia sp.]